MTDAAASVDGAGSVDYGLSIVVPAFNESQRLPATLARVAEDVVGRSLRCEVVVVDEEVEVDAEEEEGEEEQPEEDPLPPPPLKKPRRRKKT